MKIGILTVYFADYGSFAQATSLYHLLQDLGHEPEFINECYRYKYSKRLYLGYLSKQYFPSFIRSRLSKLFSVLNNYYCFNQELEQYHISPMFNSFSEIENRYDMVIIGSDELWAVHQPSVRYVPLNFSIGMSVPTITYAVSGASLTEPQYYITPEMISGISQIEMVSVRDIETKKWVREYAGIDATLVIDPTLLNPYFKQTSEHIGKYITVYGEEFEKEQIDSIKNYALETGFKLIAISWPHEWCNEFINSRSFSEIQRIFSNANYCMTSTFHGTIFALINERPFTSFSSKTRGIKVFSLLNQLDLCDRYYIPSNNYHFNASIDYEQINQKLEFLRNSSRQYLIDSLLKIEQKSIL